MRENEKRIKEREEILVFINQGLSEIQWSTRLQDTYFSEQVSIRVDLVITYRSRYKKIVTRAALEAWMLTDGNKVSKR